MTKRAARPGQAARIAAIIFALGSTVAVAEPADSANPGAVAPVSHGTAPATRAHQKNLVISAQSLGELRARIGALNTAWRAHDAKAFQAEFFVANACVVGEGMPAAACGQVAVIDTLTHMFQEAPAVTVEVVMAHQTGGTIISWLHWHILDARGATAATMRSMTVWSNVRGKWRIIGDSYSAGHI